MKYTDEATYKYKGEQVSFNYIKRPTLTQKMLIVDDVVNGVINDTVGYQPILFDYFLAVSLIENLTDIELPESFVLSSEYISDTNLLLILKSSIGGIDGIIKAADSEIEFAKSKYANKSSIDGLIEALTLVVTKYGDMFDGMDVNAVTENLAKIAEMSDMSKPEIIGNILKLKKETETDAESK